MGNEKLTTLARRLRPFLSAQLAALISGGAVSEGPDIDLVATAGGTQVGRGGDTILLFDSGGNPVAEYAATGAGLVAALAAAGNDDEIIAPYHIPLTYNAALTIPAGVIVRDLIITLTCGGNGVTLNEGSELNHCVIIQDGTGKATATAVYAAGLSSANIFNVIAVAKKATTNIGIYASGTGAFTRPAVGSSNGTAIDGSINYGIYLKDYGLAEFCTGTAQGGSVGNFGLALTGTTLAKAPIATNCAYFAKDTNSWGAIVGNGLFGTISSCTCEGVTGGMYIDTGGTLESGNTYWTTITNNGTLTYLQGDRAAYSVEDYHATDIEAAALTRHLPLPGAAGGIPYSDGTNWTRSTLTTLVSADNLPWDKVVTYEGEIITNDGDIVWLT